MRLWLIIAGIIVIILSLLFPDFFISEFYYYLVLGIGVLGIIVGLIAKKKIVV